ncbi:MAG: sigma-70 family RNA polymerase sigma factor [Planctomycetes bacterium]|nr:sigma-70 family RNA polymerase sigma factor [Planctomycetota bacterium]
MPNRSADEVLEELLVLSCRDGSERAFAELHRRFAARLRAHASHLLGRALHDRADDVCQDAWLAIARGVARLREPRRFRSWAYAIVTRRVADLRRRQGRDERLDDELRHAAAERADEPHRGDELRAALAGLSSQDRALLRLFYLDEMTVAETAAALDIPVGTVKSRLFHARRRLRRALTKTMRTRSQT